MCPSIHLLAGASRVLTLNNPGSWGAWVARGGTDQASVRQSFMALVAG